MKHGNPTGPDRAAIASGGRSAMRGAGNMAPQAAVRGFAKGGVTGAAMKAEGRNVARANNQKSSKASSKSYASGGKVGGAGHSRGGGAAVKGTRFEGVY